VTPGAPHAISSPPGIEIQLQALLTDALISYRSGEVAHGRRSLQQAARLGRPEGYRLPFLQDWAWIQSALRHDPDLASSYRQLAPAGKPLGDDQPAGPASTAAGAPVVTDELSDREREVLQRAAPMLSNAEIAGELYISVNTVKTHLGSIYRKLGAADRRQAVRCARHLKVI
jgi:LuxR family transcriptional regulator, maltose regulon positive regulatory protein